MKFLFINFYTIEAAHKPPHGLSGAGCRSLPKKANDKKPGIVWAPFVKWITEHSIHLRKKSLKKTATNPMVFFSRRLRLEEFLTYCVLYISIMFLCLMMYVNVLVIRMTDKKKFLKEGVPPPSTHRSSASQNNQHVQITPHPVLPGSVYVLKDFILSVWD